MRKRELIIAGNWKMRGTRMLVEQLLTALRTAVITHRDRELILFPPYVFLEQTQRLLAGTPIRWGGQNISQATEGADTGEISAAMLLEFGCHYVLLGHSERRYRHGETDAEISQKLCLACQVGLTPILCVGETLAQRQAGQVEQVVRQQLQALLNLESVYHQKIILAYEPVWAIGTGLSATPEQAQAVHAYLRQRVAQCDPVLAQKLCILYGGSLSARNAKALFTMPDIDGGLIGSASWDTEEFLQIYYSSL